jgi:site-specific DNA recombinase
VKQNETKQKALSEIEQKIDKLEKRYMDDEIEHETYRKYFKKYKSERAILTDQIKTLATNTVELLERQLARIKQLTRVVEIFGRAELSQQHAFLRVVFKHGFKFFEGVVRTPWIHPAFNHNLLILKEKRLLFLEQPNQNSGGIPRGGAGGIRTLVQTWYKVSFLHA